MPPAGAAVSAEDAAPIALRQRWMAALAKAAADDLECAWQGLRAPPDYSLLRPAEVGLAMIQGRAGGNGRRFNLGEMTMTRCVVRLADGTLGFSHIAGRDARKAELAAAFDALMQRPDDRERLLDEVIGPLEDSEAVRKQAMAEKVAATRVDFFTLARGD